MLAIRPVTYEVETSLSPKRVLRKLDGDLIEHRPTINILSQSNFMKNLAESQNCLGSITCKRDSVTS